MEYFQLKLLNSLSRIRYSYFKELVIISIFFLFVGCSSLRNIEIETASFPEYPISDDIQSLALLNRSMNSQFTNISSDSLEKIFIRQKMVMDTVFRDSIAADTVIHVTARELYNSGRFDVVIPKEYNINRNDDRIIINPLDVNAIQRLCKAYDVNGVLVLEGFDEQINSNYDYLPLSAGGGFEGTIDLNYKSEWRLYRPDSNKPAIRFQIGDSIFWKSSNYDLNNLYSQLPRTKEALIGGGIASGIKMANYIAPKWIKRIRYYFMTNNNDIDRAVPLIKENKWEEAAAIWTKYAAIDSKRIRSKVEFNLALAAEMNGDLNLAIEWGLKSFKTNYSTAAEEYLKILDFSRKAKQKESKERY